MPWPTVVIRIESDDWRSCTVLRMNGWRGSPQVVAGRRQFTSMSLVKVAPYLCAYGLLAEHNTPCTLPGAKAGINRLIGARITVGMSVARFLCSEPRAFVRPAE